MCRGCEERGIHHREKTEKKLLQRSRGRFFNAKLKPLLQRGRGTERQRRFAKKHSNSR
jgi:hypothetical protein